MIPLKEMFLKEMLSMWTIVSGIPTTILYSGAKACCRKNSGKSLDLPHSKKDRKAFDHSKTDLQQSNLQRLRLLCCFDPENYVMVWHEVRIML